MGDKQVVINKPIVLQDAPEYIRNFVNTVSTKLTKENEELHCKVIKEHNKYFRDNLKYIHFIMNHSKNAKINCEIYKIISEFYTQDNMSNTLKFFLSSGAINEELIICVLERMTTKITLEYVDKLLSRTSKLDNNLVSNIIDIFILYELEVNKDLVMKLLDHQVKINSLEKYAVVVDEDIYLKCIEKNFYPYELNIIPTHKIMHQILLKTSELKEIKLLQEKGGKYNTCCMEFAYKKGNSNIVKYLLNELSIQVNEECFIKCASIPNTSQHLLELLAKNYNKVKPAVVVSKQSLKLDNDATLKIEPINIIINKENEFILKNKITKFFGIQNKIIKYNSLYEIVMKYLISKNLIIGEYFVINEDLCSLLKINACTILHIDQLDNILSHFFILVN